MQVMQIYLKYKMALKRQQTLGDGANFKCIADNSDPARILSI